MSSLRHFWTQASLHHRNFQIVCTGLCVACLLLGLAAALVPGELLGAVVAIDEWLGGSAVSFSGTAVVLVQLGGTAYFVASAAMIRWLQDDLRRRHAGLTSFLFLHAAAAVAALGVFATATGHPILLVAGGVEAIVVAGAGLIAGLARMDIQGRPEGLLVPQPVGETPLGWTRLEQCWADAMLRAALPADPASGRPGLEEVDLEEFWPGYIRRVPLHFRLGLRAATWVVAVWPLVTGRTFGTFLALSDRERDEVLSAIAESPFFPVRQIPFILKTTVGFAYFSQPDIQQRFPEAYAERGDLDGAGESVDSGMERGGARGVPVGEALPSEMLADGGSAGAVEESTSD